MQKLITQNFKRLGRISSTLQKTALKHSLYPLKFANLYVDEYLKHAYSQRCYFSTKSDNPNKDNADDDNGEGIQYKPQSIPLKEFKNTTIDTSEHEIKTYVLFTSTNPIIPNTEMNANINTGYLGSAQLDNEFLYVLVNEANNSNIYTIGVVLQNDINQQLEQIIQSTSKSAQDSSNSHKNAIICVKKKDFRVKITDLEKRDGCYFVKGYVIKDEEPTEQEKSVNLKSEIAELRHLSSSIRYIKQNETPEIFNIHWDSFEKENLELDKLDELLYSVMNQLWKLSSLTKENFSEFFQTFLEQTSVIARLFLVKKKLSEVLKVVILLNQAMKYADDSVRKNTDAAKAQLSIQYLKNMYIGYSQPQPVQEPSGAAQGSATANNKMKPYLDKLHLIKDETSREKVRKEIERLSQMDKQYHEYSKIQAYLEQVFGIPWDKYSPEHWDIEYTRKVLANELYGLEKVKKRITELVAVNRLRNLNENIPKKGFVICLYGPPGTGKTSIAKALAKCLNRELRFISFAGVTDSHFVKGHRRTYVDSQPGIFVSELIKAKTMNPVFVVDEIDKMGRHGQNADPYTSLLEILNPEENENFTDHYLDIKVDFSQVIFILTANEPLNMLEPLRNRLEIIEVPAYIEQEKLIIAKNYLLPKVLEANGLLPGSIEFDDEIIIKIAKGWCYHESGVRELKRCFDKIARKFAYELIQNANKIQPTEQSTQTIESNDVENIRKVRSVNQLKFLRNEENIEGKLQKYLGLPTFDEVYERINRKAYIGVANVLTVSGFTGSVLSIEVIHDLTHPEKKGHYTVTGNLQQVLQESLLIAKVNALRLLPKEVYDEAVTKNYHVHFLEGATPKEGPSAGISICTALLSRMLEKPVSTSIAMTGELSLNGDIYKIGGIQSKVTAAKSLDIKTLIIPQGNKSEFLELSDGLKQGLTVYFVKTYSEVYDIIFGDDPSAREKVDKFTGVKPLSKLKDTSEAPSPDHA